MESIKNNANQPERNQSVESVNENELEEMRKVIAMKRLKQKEEEKMEAQQKDQKLLEWKKMHTSSKRIASPKQTEEVHPYLHFGKEEFEQVEFKEQEKGN